MKQKIKKKHIVPLHKMDYEACQTLKDSSDEDVIKMLPDLLMWMQDMNWPVAKHIKERIYELDLPLVKPIKEILNGNDGDWKWYILQDLLPYVSKNVLFALKPDIDRLAKEPTKDDKASEVDQIAKDLLVTMSKTYSL